MDGFRDGEQRRKPTPPRTRSEDTAESAHRLEEVGDLHLHAAAYRSAVDYFRSALRALSADPDGSDAERIGLYVKLAECHRRQGHFDEASGALTAARDLVPDEDAVEAAAIDVRIARVSQSQGRYRDAIGRATDAFRVLSSTDRHADVGAALMTLGIANACTGRVVKAQEFFEDALATYRRIDDVVSQAHALNNLALLAKRACRWSRALQLYDRAAELFERHGAAAEGDLLLLNVAVLHRKMGNRAEARATTERGVKRARGRGDHADLARLLLLMGQIEIDDGHVAAAERSLLEARVLAERVDMERELALADEFMGDLMRRSGRLDEAEANYALALERACALSPQNDVVAEVLRRQAELAAERNDADRALELAERGLATAKAAGEEYERGPLHRARARALHARGDVEAAIVAHGEALAVFRSQRLAREVAASIVELAELHLRTGTQQGALIARQQVREALAETGLEGSVEGDDLYHVLARAELALGHADEAMIALFELERRQEPEDLQSGARIERLRARIEERMASDAAQSGAAWLEAEARSEQLFESAENGDTADDAMKSALADIVRSTGGSRGALAVRRSGGRLDLLAWHGVSKSLARPLVTRALELIADANGDGPRVWLDAPQSEDWRPLTVRERGPRQDVVCFDLGAGRPDLEGVLLIDADRHDGMSVGFGADVLAPVSGAVVRIRESLVREAASARAVGAHEIEDSVITNSPVVADVLDLCRKVAPSPYTVLLTGETGTGKGLLARVVHRSSPRGESPFVVVNCAAIPDSLLESELFGHVRGAFTGADRDKEGLIRSANGGTLFLDEIGKMPLPMQAKLLQFLDDRHVRPVGGKESREVDVRVICATKRDLRDMVARGEFLEDLYYRLMDFPIDVPPLRRRGDDVSLLAEHFLTRSARELERTVPHLTREALRCLRAHPWPGNVRELEKTLRRAVVLAGDGENVRRTHLPAEIRDLAGTDGAETPASGKGTSNGLVPLRQRIAEVERNAIGEALHRAGWNRSQAARTLGVSYPTLLQKIRTYGLSPD